MKNQQRIKKVVRSIEAGQHSLANLTPKQRTILEKEWDVEHAYYSSALEGSNIDRNEFNSLGKKVT